MRNINKDKESNYMYIQSSVAYFWSILRTLNTHLQNYSYFADWSRLLENSVNAINSGVVLHIERNITINDNIQPVE